MENCHAILFLHMYGSLTLNQLQLIMHTHDFRLKLRIRVLRVHQKIESLRVKINGIKYHHRDPCEKTSELDPSLDQFDPVSRIFKFKWDSCSWRHIFETEFSNLTQNIT